MDESEFRDLEAFIDEHELIPVIIFTSPEARPVDGVARVYEESPVTVRVLIQDMAGTIDQQLIFDRDKLRARIDDPTIPGDQPPG